MPDDSGKKTERVSLALEGGFKKRLATCAKRTKLKPHSLAQAAIEAAVDAIERADYRLVVPIELHVAYVPIPNPSAPKGTAMLHVQQQSTGSGLDKPNPRKADKRGQKGKA